VECDLPPPEGGPWGELTMTASREFVPDEVEGNGDLRSLAVRVYDLSIQKQ
jgi:hypothetical protein